MDDKKKHTIIKIILIIIIILLLIHNCNMIKKRGKSKTPSGNVNIIEITCEDSNKCDVKPVDNKDNNSDVTDNSQDSDNSKKTTGTKKNSNTGSTNGGSGSSSNDSGSNSSSSDDEEPITDTVVEPENEMFVRDNRLVWNDTTELKIFTNSFYNFEDKIAPEASNTYQFVVKNSTAYKLKYTMSFLENNPYSINMKYRLKKNDTYLIDHYVSFGELLIGDQFIDAKTNDTYYLEWKWFSADNDNDAGENSASYSLNIKVEAESV